MAIKPFAIQGSDLTLGGVNLQAGSSTIVIPGLTQATNYFVEEVDERDGNNPDTFGSNTNFVYVIDNAEYVYLSGGAQPSGSYQTAIYNVDELDDGQIEEIDVESQGIFSAADKNRAEVNYMWAIRHGQSQDPLDPFVAGDWTQIPFRPKIRAGEVTNVGGNANTGDWAFSGNVAYNGTSYNQGLYVAPGGEGVSYIFVPGNSQSANIPLQLANGSSTGQVNITAYNKQWEFDNRGVLRLPADGDIVNSGGQSVLGGGSNSYTPEDPDDWDSPAVNTIQAALDELAARVTALQNFEIDGGNAYTPAAGELLIDGNGA